MTLPNKLTLARIIVIPIIIIIGCIPWLRDNMLFHYTYLLNGDYFTGGISYANFINVILFALASFTDFLDGYLARKNNLVTTFGKFADPLADKMLVIISLIILMYQNTPITIGKLEFNIVPVWGVCIIILRELMVSGIRLVAAERGQVIAAGWAGKVKTVVTMIAIILAFVSRIWYVLEVIALFTMYAAIILTVYSGFVYLWNSRKVIFESI